MKVLATRPEKQNAAWVNRLQSDGYCPVALPLIDIRPVADTAAIQNITNKILALDEYCALIFVSQNAVAFGLEWVDKYWPQLPSGLQWFAVGAKTARCLNAHPLLSAEKVFAAKEQMNSEELLQDEGLQKATVFGKKILIFRGLGGRTRTLLGDSLRERGATVDYCELYQRSPPEQLQQAQFNAQDTLVPVFSCEALENFHHFFCSSAELLKTVHLVVPGQRVFNFAKELGFERIEMAVNAGEQAMLNAIKKAVKL